MQTVWIRAFTFFIYSPTIMESDRTRCCIFFYFFPQNFHPWWGPKRYSLQKEIHSTSSSDGDFPHPPFRLNFEEQFKPFGLAKCLKLLLDFACKHLYAWTSDDCWRNKIFNMFRLDVMNDVNVNTKAALERFTSSLLTWFHIGVFLIHSSV